ncbi:toll/interleukin-1 receptor domain-containing protein [Agriterribacter sp.]|uniref:toll/interleukin-1 receptor domain-containing protein n=1 Tax=Agriterribacter sp. TaxID=2821509 RepID=UPI002CCBAC86|nr:toll/interleukin-1 receptor domain-containing protein [Agriterribacter sp.]HRO47937.1 toll/interleukin-1 receptor domain-containing protein [Agriterribacter sp.]HRQ18618.1 toll/interleukin-1 receptor domain-containing protein [Agriterribacter sp.]
MADIFISYSSEDKTRVKAIAETLEHKGWSVWWDRQIPVGQRYDTVIEQELNKAKCVIVIWTQRSVNSEWVKNEASDAAQRNILAPVLLEDITIPLAFRRIEAARLTGWNGERDHPELEILFSAVAAIINGPTITNTATTHDAQSVLKTEAAQKKKYILLTLAALGALLVALGIFFFSNESRPRVIRITGQVKTAAEIPITGVEVNADGTRFYATTITNGTYDLRLENYTVGDEVTLTTSNKDFEDKTIAVKISSREMKVDFVLNPVTR